MRSRAALLAIAVATGCAPVYQDARIVPRGEVVVTPSVSPVMASANGETAHVANQFGAHVLVGVTNRWDVGVGYARYDSTHESDGALNFVGFGARYGLVPGRLALIAPAGFAFGGVITDVGETFQVQPGLLFTTPVNAYVDFNPSVRFIVPFCEGCDTLLAFNLGLGIGSPARRTVFRPEIGFAVSPGERGVSWSFGAGVTLRARVW